LAEEKPDDYSVMMEVYTEYCPAAEKCKKKLCRMAHNSRDLRRKLFNACGELNYIAFPCPHLNSAEPCPYEANCHYYHTENELAYHPSIYKTTLECNKRWIKSCSKGSLCPNYHRNDKDRRNENTSRTLTSAAQTQFEPMPKQKGKRTLSGPAVQFEMLNKAKTKLINSESEGSLRNNKSDNSQKQKKKQQPTNPNVVMLLDLQTFKTQQCPHKTKHEKERCPYYHDSKDRRRVPGIYGPEMCSYSVQKKKCPDED